MKVIAILFAIISYATIIIGNILIMIYGWGVQPVSWWWIIGGYSLFSGVSAVFQAVMKKLWED
jgi:hypothetical protein